MSHNPRTITAAREHARALRIDLVRPGDEVPQGPYPQGPYPDPCRCGAPRWEHAGRNNNGRCERTGCTRWSQDVAYALAVAALDGDGRKALQDVRDYHSALRRGDLAPPPRHRPPPRRERAEGSWGVSLSDLGSCRAAIGYRERPPAHLVRLPEWRGEATLGAMLHDGIEDARRALYPWRRFEERVVLDPYGLDATTRHDEYDPITESYVEIKSAGEGAWEQVIEGPRESHLRQAMCNAAILVDRGDPVAAVTVLYIHREKGYERPFTVPFDAGMAREGFDYLLGIVSALDADEPLPRDHSGPTDSPICKRCPFRVTCWDMGTAEALGRSPESLLRLGPTPEERDVETLLEQYVAARDAKDDDTKKQIKVLLRGVPYGRYGDLVWADHGSERVDQAAYVAAIRAAYESDERPPFDAIKQPRRYVPSETVKPVPAPQRRRRKPDPEPVAEPQPETVEVGS